MSSPNDRLVAVAVECLSLPFHCLLPAAVQYRRQEAILCGSGGGGGGYMAYTTDDDEDSSAVCAPLVEPSSAQSFFCLSRHFAVSLFPFLFSPLSPRSTSTCSVPSAAVVNPLLDCPLALLSPHALSALQRVCRRQSRPYTAACPSSA